MKNGKLSKRQTISISAILLALTMGCRDSSKLDTAQVRGQVTLNGKLYTQGGKVMFQPQTAGKMALGLIQSDGTYELSTYSPGDGAIVGTHLAIVLPAVEGADIPEAEPTAGATRSQIPAKYGTTSTSGLVCDVKAGQQNEFPIDMLSK